ncbi:MAG: alpha/beta hydrolase [Bacteroidia bacterium]|nr:alpha/beta hydrolase [Bacteroidia bacterium]
MKVILFFYRLYFNVLSLLAPKTAAKKAFELFQGVRNKKIRSNEKPFFDVADSFITPFEGEDLICYELGNPSGKLVLLVHGWDSHPGAMSAIGFDLAKRGYYVVSFNLPGHGTQKRRRNNLLLSAMAIDAVIRRLRPSHPISIVTHSFGSAATSFSLSRSGIPVDQLIFLTSPNRLEKVFRDYQKLIALPEKTFKLLIRRAENLLKRKMNEMNVQRMWEDVNYRHLTMIHDKDDRIIPFENAQYITSHWPNSELIALEGTGHYKMLWDEKVIALIGDHLDKTYARVQENQAELV